MAAIAFDVALFRERFPAFADPTLYPTPVLEGYWETASCIFGPGAYRCLVDDCRVRAIMLLTAHLAQLSAMIASGVTPGVVTSATVDKVSVSLMQPPSTDAWSWWLAMTPYGAQLWAILSTMAVGGMYIGGLPERAAFRKVFGLY